MKPPDFTIDDCIEYCSVHGENTSPARAELAQLRQLAEARRILISEFGVSPTITDIWLSANAPAPQAEPQRTTVTAADERMWDE